MYNLWWLCIFFAAAALTQHFWLEAKYTMWTCTSQGGDVEESKTNPLSDIFCCKNESSELGKSYLIYNWRFQPVNSYFENHFPFFCFADGSPCEEQLWHTGWNTWCVFWVREKPGCFQVQFLVARTHAWLKTLLILSGLSTPRSETMLACIYDAVIM